MLLVLRDLPRALVSTAKQDKPGGRVAERWWKTERGRKRLAEIGDIVLGVLIALTLGAIASEIGWRFEVANARDALADELGEIVGQARERERADGCIEAKLDVIGNILTAAETSGRLPPTGRIGKPMYRTWSHGVWDSTLNAEIGSHFDREDLDNLSGAYQFVDIINRHAEEEVEAWTRLYAIVGPGRAISPAEIADLRQALSLARTAHRYIVLSGIRMDQIVAAFHLPLSQNSVDDYADLNNDETCGPIPPPDGRSYGEAPNRGVVQKARASPITRDSPGLPQR